MRIIETCPAFCSGTSIPAVESAESACVSDPLHAVVGSWLGPVVEPKIGPKGPAPRPTSVVRCDEPGWR